MERDGTGQLSTIYTYGNQRINSESYNNLSGLYTYDGRGSVSAVIGSYGDFRASYWYDGLGNVKSQIHGYGAFGSGKKYYGYNAEQYNPATGNQNLRNRQVNIRRQRFLTEDTYLGMQKDILSINRYIYGNDNPLKFKDPSGNKVQYIFVGNDVNNIGHNFVDAVNKDLKNDDKTYGELKDAFAKAKANANSSRLGCYNDINDSYSWNYDRIIAEYDSENDITLDVDINIIKDIHYSRNDYNTYNGGAFPEHINDDIKNNWNSGVAANAHQFSRKEGYGRNVKYVDETGRLEAIYDSRGNFVIDSRDIGTYNFAPSDDDKIFGDIPNPLAEQNQLHSQLDINPWLEWGNASDDTTSYWDRLGGLIFG